MNAPRRHPLARYGFALLAVAGALASIAKVGLAASSLLFLAVFLSAWYGGLGPGLFATGVTTALAVFLVSRGPVNLAAVISISLFTAGGILITLAVRSMDRARRRAEENAAEADRHSERLRTTLRSIGDAVIVTDERERIVSLNPVAEALTGWSQAEAEGRRLDEVFRIANEETLAVVENPADRALREGAVVGLANHTVLLARDGTRRPIDDSAAPIRGADGRVSGVVLVFRDVGERRDTERRVARAEARFRAFMDHSPVVAYIKDDYGRYVWGNAAWGRLHGGGLESSIGKTDFELWPAETAIRFRQGDHAALASEAAIEALEPSLSADGSTHHWMTLKFRIGDEGRPLVGGISVDATDRVESDRALRESEARYRTLFESNPLPMWVYDVDELRFLAVNEAAIDRYGYAREEFLAMRIADIRPPEDIPRLVERVRNVRDSTFLVESPWRHRKKDGTIIDVEIVSHAITFEGRPARLVLAHDVTARRRAEEALRISRERLDLVLDSAELGIWYGDNPTGTLTFNDRARDHHRIGPDEVPTLDLLDSRLHPEDRGPTGEAVRRAIEEGLPYDTTYRVPSDAGRDRWVRAIGRAYPDETGRVARFDGISIDVTRQKEAEEQLREATGAAVEANRAKDKFLAVLGHELRTPLTPILAAVSTLLDPRDGPGPPVLAAEEVREMLAMIRRNVELETRLINDLLDISRVERGQLRLQLDRVDLHRALREAVDICRDEILVSGLDVRLALVAEGHHVEADRARILQIAWNLIHNAVKFSPPGARLTVRTANPPRAGDATGGEPPEVVVEFEDTGAGMEPEVLARVFDPFEQGGPPTQRRVAGLGLGLAISRSIAEAHGGRLTATSPGRGRGSTFRLELRTAPRPVPSDAPPPPPLDEGTTPPPAGASCWSRTTSTRATTSPRSSATAAIGSCPPRASPRRRRPSRPAAST